MWKVFEMCLSVSLRLSLDLTVPSDCECEVSVVQSLKASVPQTFSLSGKRGTSGTFSLGEQIKMVRMNLQRTPV